MVSSFQNCTHLKIPKNWLKAYFSGEGHTSATQVTDILLCSLSIKSRKRLRITIVMITVYLLYCGKLRFLFELTSRPLSKRSNVCGRQMGN